MTCCAVTLLVMSPCICVTPSIAAIGCRSTATIFGALSGLQTRQFGLFGKCFLDQASSSPACGTFPVYASRSICVHLLS